jgi:4-hydroxy-3-polyprenylbenzoate decarboxylase
MNAIWSLNQLMYSKLVIVVDESVDVQNEETVWFQVGATVDPQRDIMHTHGPAEYLDHATTIAGVGQKLGIDATAKLPEEGHTRPWPDAFDMPQEIEQLITRRWGEYHIGDDDSR